MVSLQPAQLSPEENKASHPHLEDFLSKKRKLHRDEEDGQSRRNWLGSCREPKLAKTEEKKPDIELHLDAPLPLEWQQCLDIQSGEIHFYNTRTHKRTSKDPRLSPEAAPAPAPVPRQPVSLDLELNLACEPRIRSADAVEKGEEHRNGKRCDLNEVEVDCTGVGRATSPSPWISLDADRQEMVATVCMRCHMLVMMCKATLSCPNCKFVHPPVSHRSSASSTTSIKPTLKLLCCKD